jgi:hypothetical protein
VEVLLSEDRVAFPAQIKLISVKSLMSLDTEGEIKLRFLPTDEVLEGLHRMHRGDANVMVAIVPLQLQAESEYEIQKRAKR